jgi:acetyl esterase/lipase
MIFCYLILLGIVAYALLLLLPKGNLLQEIGQLPFYLWKVWQVSLKSLQREKHTFGAHRKQYFILYQSNKSKASSKPLVIYYHGGGWTFGSPEKFAVNAKFFTDLGHPVIMPSYRRLPINMQEAIAEDRLLALQQIQQLMKEKGWQGRKIILGGMSAGGNVAALLLYDTKSLYRIGFDRSRFAGIMLHGAPLDLSAMASTPLLYCYAGSKASTSFAKANPISFLNEDDDIPALVIHGTKDGMVDYGGSENFLIKGRTLQFKNTTSLILEDGTHLDVGRWVFEENESARLIREWLREL